MNLCTYPHYVLQQLFLRSSLFSSALKLRKEIMGQDSTFLPLLEMFPVNSGNWKSPAILFSLNCLLFV